MAVTVTPRFGVTRWSDGNDNFNREQMDNSHAAIEEKGVIYLQGTALSRPSAGVVGRFYYSTNTQELSYDTGVDWQLVSSSTYALGTTTFTAGDGLTGGGDLSANRTISVNFSTNNPTMSGISSPGTATTVSRADHIHPTDTSRAPLASPSFTGVPTTPTASADTNTTQIATTAFVLGQAGSATPLVDGTAAVGTSTRYARQDHVHGTDTTRAPLASPALTGTPTAPTAGVDTTTTQVATTAFVIGQASNTNPLMDGSVATGTSTRYARADHIHASDTSRAPLASPALTGTPTSPTAPADTNTTQVATTAFVLGQASSTLPATLGSAGVGTSTRYARADHIHAMPTAANVGAISTDALTSTNPASLGSVSPGVSTNVSRVDHVHAMPSASNVGAIPTSALTATAPANLASTASSGTSTDVARRDHVHALPTSTDVGAIPASLISGSKGALVTSTGSAVAALTPGTNGQVLTADSAATNGIKWSAPADLAALVLPPIGAIMPYAGDSAPSGWLICDGSQYSSATYPELSTICGTKFGTASTGLFRIPDFRGRMSVGLDTSQVEFGTIGKTGGAKNITLTTSNMPSHTHTIPAHDHTTPNHDHSVSPVGFTITGGDHGHGHTLAVASASHTHTSTATPNRFVTSLNVSENTNTSGGGVLTRVSSVSANSSNLSVSTTGGDHHHGLSGSVSSSTSHSHGILGSASITGSGSGISGSGGSGTSGSAGSGAAVGVLNPFITMNYIIRAS